ncbi:MAG: cation-transporting P-type ATPase [Candidatus Bathyarchaeota archaeon]|nr:cation-transporting P-type ATPase [Candidatus Bathyarchaeota archaeon]
MSGGYHAKQKHKVLAEAGVDPERGLSSQEAAARLNQNGPNLIAKEHHIRFLSILREEITEPMILLLIAVGVLYSIWGSITDTLTILSVIVILVLVEVYNEYRAKKSIDALKKLASPTATVLRNGQATEIQTANIVVGDVLLLRAGQRVPADARLLDAYGLEVDESSLTGESFPIAKDAQAVMSSKTIVAEQQNMVFSGTIITKGQAKALVITTAAQTELGKVADITKAAKEPKTPLQLSMKQLSKALVWIALFFSILVPLLAFIRGLPAEEAILYGLSLSFATIPEELPIIITMVLGVGAFTLSHKNAVVKRLRAAETLGSTTVIASDKTGTLTQSKMNVDSMYFDGKFTRKSEFGTNQNEALKTALLASDSLQNVTGGSLSNPMAQALLETVQANGADLKTLQKTWRLQGELSFDNKRKLASYIYQLGANSFVLLSSGAPENILANSSKLLLRGEETKITPEMRSYLDKAVLGMAKMGQRLLAFGYRRITPEQAKKPQDLEHDYVLVGILGFVDPPRKEVQEAIQTCKRAGIKVLMITGDHPETARAIAGQVGINNAKALTGTQIGALTDTQLKQALQTIQVFARTTPQDKLRLVRLLRENGEIVAVTGDGVNDAPALKEAHIGIAMGIRGTDVAKETADMVLADDNFATITTAIKEGRKIFANLKKGVRYYLACKIALVLSFLLPLMLGVPLPFAPIQIIVLELFMDLAASATFVAEPQEPRAMQTPPLNPRDRFLNRSLQKTLLIGALSLFTAVSISYLYTWYTTQDLVVAQTAAFAAWMIGHIFLALNLRSDSEPLLKLGFFSNKLMLIWGLLAVSTLLVATNLSFMHEALKITSLDPAQWLLVFGVAFAATFWMELRKLLTKNKPK